MMRSDKLFRGTIILIVLLIVWTMIVLGVNSWNVLMNSKAATKPFMISLTILSMALIIEGLACWIIWRRYDAYLQVVKWIQAKKSLAATILFVMLLITFLILFYVSWMRIFSSLKIKDYPLIKETIKFSIYSNSFFIWDWLLLVLVIILTGYLLLISKNLFQEIVVQSKTGSTIINFSISLSFFAMCLVGVQRSIPHWLISKSVQAERLIKEPYYIQMMIGLWVWTALIVIGSSILMKIYYKEQWKVINGIPFLIALAISCILITRYALIITPLGYYNQWDVLYRSEDSAGYTQYYWDRINTRPPLYPIFVQSIAGEKAIEYLADIPLREPVKLFDNPLIKVIRWQKLLVLVSSVLAAFFMMGFLRSPLPALIFLAFYDTAYYADFFGYLLTEAVAAAWLFLILATFFGFFWKKHWGFILAMGVGCAGIYLTRPSGIFCLVFLAAVIVYVMIKRQKEYWRSVVASVIVMVIIMFVPSIIEYAKNGRLTPTPMFALQSVAFAIEVAQPGDIGVMPDEESRRFLSYALEKKERQIEEAKEKYPEDVYADAEMRRLIFRITNNKYYMAIGPTSAQEALGGGATLAETTALMQKVSIILLKRHWREYLSIGVRQFNLTMSEISRLRIQNEYIVLFVGTIILCILIGGEVGVVSLALLLAYLANIVITSFFETPLYRYVYPYEFLVILSWSVLLVWWGSRMVLRKINHLQGN